jgi:hypothetical protein
VPHFAIKRPVVVAALREAAEPKVLALQLAAEETNNTIPTRSLEVNRPHTH